MNSASARREDQHVQVLTQQTKCLIASLLVVLSGVFNNQRIAPVEVFRYGEWQAANKLVLMAFCRIVGHSYQIIVPTKIPTAYSDD